MKVSYGKLALINFVFLGLAVRAGAQDVGASASSQPVSITAPPTQSANSIADEKLAKRVKDALHADRYFYDEHVTASVESGAVVLRGFVNSGWDIRDAVRIARKAAGDSRVIDDLSINDLSPKRGR